MYKNINKCKVSQIIYKSYDQAIFVFESHHNLLHHIVHGYMSFDGIALGKYCVKMPLFNLCLWSIFL